jgi:DNA-binding response OmpR family regulator
VKNSQKKRILIVEDDLGIATAMADALVFEGWQVQVANDGTDAVSGAKTFEPDAIVLDLMLPGLNGFEVIEEVRHFSNVPIIILTARSEEEDQLHVLELGADDFLAKPLRPSILVAHIKVWLRRYEYMKEQFKNQETKILEASNIIMNIDSHTVTREFDGNTHYVPLTPTEFSLLNTMMKDPTKVYSREYLLKEVWNWDNAEGTRTVDSHVKSLRKKLTASGSHDPIRTVHGIGYTLNK